MNISALTLSVSFLKSFLMPETLTEETLVAQLLAGSKRACGRLISLVENESPGYLEALKAIYPHAENAPDSSASGSDAGYIIGVTGPPGSGKSTLVDKLAKQLTDSGEKTGIVAVDPTSPFTNGAILGDRIRMDSVSGSGNTFIRSMGTRGHLGGISRATADVLVILSAFGCRYIFVETVGVGQSEMDIVKCADTVLMVLAPGLGDDIQALKAGVMEIGDVFAVNKADREGAEKTCRETRAMLDFKSDWDFKPPVCLTMAESGEGVDILMENILAHKNFLLDSGKLAERRRRKKAAHIKGIVSDRLDRRIEMHIEDMILSYKEMFNNGHDFAGDPYSLAEIIINQINSQNKI